MIGTVLDTGPIVASLNASDKRHAECARLLTTLAGRRLLPSPVLTEVCWLLERWPEVEAAFLDEVARGTFELIHLSPADLTRMAELVRDYADFPLGAVDASVVAVAERFDVDRMATLDRRHFGAGEAESRARPDPPPIGSHDGPATPSPGCGSPWPRGEFTCRLRAALETSDDEMHLAREVPASGAGAAGGRRGSGADPALRQPVRWTV